MPINWIMILSICMEVCQHGRADLRSVICLGAFLSVCPDGYLPVCNLTVSLFLQCDPDSKLAASVGTDKQSLTPQSTHCSLSDTCLHSRISVRINGNDTQSSVTFFYLLLPGIWSLHCFEELVAHFTHTVLTITSCRL